MKSLSVCRKVALKPLSPDGSEIFYFVEYFLFIFISLYKLKSFKNFIPYKLCVGIDLAKVSKTFQFADERRASPQRVTTTRVHTGESGEEARGKVSEKVASPSHTNRTKDNSDHRTTHEKREAFLMRVPAFMKYFNSDRLSLKLSSVV